MNNKATAESISEDIARYILLGQPVPEHLSRALITELCNEYQKEKEGLKSRGVQVDMEGV